MNRRYASLALLVIATSACGELLGIDDRELAVCSAGERRCGDAGRERCNDDGTAFVSDLCPVAAPLCADEGACVVCITGDARCGDAGRETCLDGAWQSEPCTEDRFCEEGACVVCSPGEFSCDATSGLRQRCLEDGSGSQVDACPGSFPLCEDGACVLCSPGATRCTPTGRETCAADGTGFEPVGCDVDDSCIAHLFTGAGDGFECVATSCGNAWCWGKNTRKQIDGAVGSSVLTPRKIALPTPIVAGTTGVAHTCVLDNVGEVYCWGDNIGGQANGVGVSSMPVTEPTHIPLDAPAQRIEAGTYHTCAILIDGRVQCWGDPTFLKLGGDGSSYLAAPVSADETGSAPLDHVVDVACDRVSTCAVRDTGELVCWGVLDLGDYFDDNLVTVAGYAVTVLTANAREVAGGWYHRVVVGPFGAMGEGDSRCGELGFVGGIFGNFLPLLFGSLDAGKITKLSAGHQHTCGRIADTAFCLGESAQGQLGTGGPCADTASGEAYPPSCAEPVLDPNPVDLPGPVVELVARWDHTCALVRIEDELRPYCWGSGAFGALGNAGMTCSSTPIAVTWPESGLP
ncbi:MAG: hypothetical protein U0271_08275 [Polyangiaceae bacterium]